MHKITNKILASVSLIASFGFTSCENFIYEEGDNCVQGIALNFVYDYHMEPGANAFPTNVDCVNVMVFDKNLNFITQFTETSKDLKNPDYRMEIPLNSGDYHLVVYGGLGCENPSFSINHDWFGYGPQINHKDDIRVNLPLDEDRMSNSLLHDLDNRTGGLFYGSLDLTITDEDLAHEYRRETVYMMKDTNHIQVILQELNTPSEVDYNDFEFKIVDDNAVLDGYNDIVSDGQTNHYRPFAAENRIMGYTEYQGTNGALNEEDDAKPVQVGCVEFSTSRLVDEHYNSARLVVTKKSDTRSGEPGQTIIDIPLVAYLEAIRGFGQNWIKSDQEYLDRESRWTLMFFLQNGKWLQSRISVNAWTVRINNAEL